MKGQINKWFWQRCWMEELARQSYSPTYTIQCDVIRLEQFENWHFSGGYNFWTNDLILILKTPTRSYSCLAKVVFCLNVSFISCRLKKTVRFRTVPIWLHHRVVRPQGSSTNLKQNMSIDIVKFVLWLLSHLIKYR